MYDETYAIIEIASKYIKFIVGKYKPQIGLKVVFKQKERSQKSWLTEDNDILDTNLVYHRLNKMICKYEHQFKEKIKAVSVIYPTSSIVIKNGSSRFVNPNPSLPISPEQITFLHKDVKDCVFEHNLVITNIIPYEYIINNELRTSIPPIGKMGKMVTMNAKIYAVDKKVYNSFGEILKKLNLGKLISLNQMYAVAKQCNHEAFDNTFVLINWEWNSIDIGFFTKKTLVKAQSLEFGVKHIIQILAQRMATKFDVADKYIFKLLNLDSKKNNDMIIYRKYLANEKRTYELTEEQIKQMLIEELNLIIDKTDVLISKELKNIKNFKVYHVGKITEIAGFKKVLLRSNYRNETKYHYSSVTGASEIWTYPLCGMIRILHEENKKFRNIKTSTKEFVNPKMVNANSNLINHPNRAFDLPINQNPFLANSQQAQNYMNYQSQIQAQQQYQNNQNYYKNVIINKQRNN